MADNPLDDVVSSQYTKWAYPQPIGDLPGWLTSNWQWFDPSHAHAAFWPDRAYKPDLDILIAGCGTNQAAVFAYTNPSARVVAIDVSEAALAHHRHLRDSYALGNLELHRLPIEEIATLGRQFDLIVSTGVLHHLADPAATLRSLGTCLRHEGVVALMLYARYGRHGVEMLQGLFRDLGLRQDEASLAIVRQAIASLAPDHPVRSYLRIAPDLDFDAGLVDTFLHGRDRSYTVDDCLDLVASAGLVFQEWFMKACYYPPVNPTNDFEASLAALPEARQWAAMERINSRNACHFFTACRADRPTARYRIDFASPAATDYVPALRYRCGLEGDEILRPGFRRRLDPLALALAQQIDGRRTLREIVNDASRRGGLPQRDAAEGEALGRQVCRALWQDDFLAIHLQSDK